MVLGGLSCNVIHNASGGLRAARNSEKKHVMSTLYCVDLTGFRRFQQGFYIISPGSNINESSLAFGTGAQIEASISYTVSG